MIGIQTSESNQTANKQTNKQTSRTMFGPTTVSSDILDIGTRNAEDKRRQDMTSGTGALCPAKFLGEPAAFDVPNVADVSHFRLDLD